MASQVPVLRKKDIFLHMDLESKDFSNSNIISFYLKKRKSLLEFLYQICYHVTIQNPMKLDIRSFKFI